MYSVQRKKIITFSIDNSGFPNSRSSQWLRGTVSFLEQIDMRNIHLFQFLSLHNAVKIRKTVQYFLFIFPVLGKIEEKSTRVL